MRLSSEDMLWDRFRNMSIILETGLRDVGESVPLFRARPPDRYADGKSNGREEGEGLELGEPAIRPDTMGDPMKEF